MHYQSWISAKNGLYIWVSYKEFEWISSLKYKYVSGWHDELIELNWSFSNLYA